MMSVSATDLTAVAMLLIGIGSLLGGLGIFFWGIRHLLFAQAEVEAERRVRQVPKAVTAS